MTQESETKRTPTQEEIVHLQEIVFEKRKASYAAITAAANEMLDRAIAERDLHQALANYGNEPGAENQEPEKFKIGLTVLDIHQINGLKDIKTRAKAAGIRMTVTAIDPPEPSPDKTPELRIQFEF